MSTDGSHGLPTLHTASWRIGWKVARLMADTKSGTLAFYPIVADGLASSYGPLSEAICNYCSWHTSPEDDCRCGFNAFEEQADALSYAQKTKLSPRAANLGLLRVGLAGEVLGGTMMNNDATWGYRASRQSVSDVFISPVCAGCGINISDRSLC